MDKKELIFKILNELNQHDKLLTKEELEMSLQEYGELLEMMLADELVEDITVQRAGIGNNIKYVFGRDVKITINGIEYLKQNKK